MTSVINENLKSPTLPSVMNMKQQQSVVTNERSKLLPGKSESKAEQDRWIRKLAATHDPVISLDDQLVPQADKKMKLQKLPPKDIFDNTLPEKQPYNRSFSEEYAGRPSVITKYSQELIQPAETFSKSLSDLSDVQSDLSRVDEVPETIEITGNSLVDNEISIKKPEKENDGIETEKTGKTNAKIVADERIITDIESVEEKIIEFLHSPKKDAVSPDYFDTSEEKRNTNRIVGFDIIGSDVSENEAGAEIGIVNDSEHNSSMPSIRESSYSSRKLQKSSVSPNEPAKVDETFKKLFGKNVNLVLPFVPGEKSKTTGNNAEQTFQNDAKRNIVEINQSDFIDGHIISDLHGKNDFNLISNRGMEFSANKEKRVDENGMLMLGKNDFIMPLEETNKFKDKDNDLFNNKNIALLNNFNKLEEDVRPEEKTFIDKTSEHIRLDIKVKELMNHENIFQIDDVGLMHKNTNVKQNAKEEKKQLGKTDKIFNKVINGTIDFQNSVENEAGKLGLITGKSEDDPSFHNDKILQLHVPDKADSSSNAELDAEKKALTDEDLRQIREGLGVVLPERKKIKDEIKEVMDGKWKDKKDVSQTILEENLSMGKLKADNKIQAALKERLKMENEMLLAQKEKLKIDKEMQLAQKEKLKIDKEMQLVQKEKLKMDKEMQLVQKEKMKIDKEMQLAQKEKLQMNKELQLAQKEKLQIDKELQLSPKEDINKLNQGKDIVEKNEIKPTFKQSSVSLNENIKTDNIETNTPSDAKPTTFAKEKEGTIDSKNNKSYPLTSRSIPDSDLNVQETTINASVQSKDTAFLSIQQNKDEELGSKFTNNVHSRKQNIDEKHESKSPDTVFPSKKYFETNYVTMASSNADEINSLVKSDVSDSVNKTKRSSKQGKTKDGKVKRKSKAAKDIKAMDLQVAASAYIPVIELHLKEEEAVFFPVDMVSYGDVEDDNVMKLGYEATLEMQDIEILAPVLELMNTESLLKVTLAEADVEKCGDSRTVQADVNNIAALPFNVEIRQENEYVGKLNENNNESMQINKSMNNLVPEKTARPIMYSVTISQNPSVVDMNLANISDILPGIKQNDVENSDVVQLKELTAAQDKAENLYRVASHQTSNVEENDPSIVNEILHLDEPISRIEENDPMIAYEILQLEEPTNSAGLVKDVYNSSHNITISQNPSMAAASMAEDRQLLTGDRSEHLIEPSDSIGLRWDAYHSSHNITISQNPSVVNINPDVLKGFEEQNIGDAKLGERAHKDVLTDEIEVIGTKNDFELEKKILTDEKEVPGAYIGTDEPMPAVDRIEPFTEYASSVEFNHNVFYSSHNITISQNPSVVNIGPDIINFVEKQNVDDKTLNVREQKKIVAYEFDRISKNLDMEEEKEILNDQKEVPSTYIGTDEPMSDVDRSELLVKHASSVGLCQDAFYSSHNITISQNPSIVNISPDVQKASEEQNIDDKNTDEREQTEIVADELDVIGKKLEVEQEKEILADEKEGSSVLLSVMDKKTSYVDESESVSEPAYFFEQGIDAYYSPHNITISQNSFTVNIDSIVNNSDREQNLNETKSVDKEEQKEFIIDDPNVSNKKANAQEEKVILSDEPNVISEKASMKEEKEILYNEPIVIDKNPDAEQEKEVVSDEPNIINEKPDVDETKKISSDESNIISEKAAMEEENEIQFDKTIVIDKNPDAEEKNEISLDESNVINENLDAEERKEISSDESNIISEKAGMEEEKEFPFDELIVIDKNLDLDEEKEISFREPSVKDEKAARKKQEEILFDELKSIGEKIDVEEKKTIITGGLDIVTEKPNVEEKEISFDESNMIGEKSGVEEPKEIFYDEPKIIVEKSDMARGTEIIARESNISCEKADVEEGTEIIADEINVIKENSNIDEENILVNKFNIISEKPVVEEKKISLDELYIKSEESDVKKGTEIVASELGVINKKAYVDKLGEILAYTPNVIDQNIDVEKDKGISANKLNVESEKSDANEEGEISDEKPDKPPIVIDKQIPDDNESNTLIEPALSVGIDHGAYYSSHNITISQNPSMMNIDLISVSEQLNINDEKSYSKEREKISTDQQNVADEKFGGDEPSEILSEERTVKREYSNIEPEKEILIEHKEEQDFPYPIEGTLMCNIDVNEPLRDLIVSCGPNESLMDPILPHGQDDYHSSHDIKISHNSSLEKTNVSHEDHSKSDIEKYFIQEENSATQKEITDDQKETLSKTSSISLKIEQEIEEHPFSGEIDEGTAIGENIKFKKVKSEVFIIGNEHLVFDPLSTSGKINTEFEKKTSINEDVSLLNKFENLLIGTDTNDKMTHDEKVPDNLVAAESEESFKELSSSEKIVKTAEKVIKTVITQAKILQAANTKFELKQYSDANQEVSSTANKPFIVMDRQIPDENESNTLIEPALSVGIDHGAYYSSHNITISQNPSMMNIDLISVSEQLNINDEKSYSKEREKISTDQQNVADEKFGGDELSEILSEECTVKREYSNIEPEKEILIEHKEEQDFPYPIEGTLMCNIDVNEPLRDLIVSCGPNESLMDPILPHGQDAYHSSHDIKISHNSSLEKTNVSHEDHSKSDIEKYFIQEENSATQKEITDDQKETLSKTSSISLKIEQEIEEHPFSGEIDEGTAIGENIKFKKVKSEVFIIGNEHLVFDPLSTSGKINTEFEKKTSINEDVSLLNKFENLLIGTDTNDKMTHDEKVPDNLVAAESEESFKELSSSEKIVKTAEKVIKTVITQAKILQVANPKFELKQCIDVNQEISNTAPEDTIEQIKEMEADAVLNLREHTVSGLNARRKDSIAIKVEKEVKDISVDEATDEGTVVGESVDFEKVKSELILIGPMEEDYHDTYYNTDLLAVKLNEVPPIEISQVLLEENAKNNEKEIMNNLISSENIEEIIQIEKLSQEGLTDGNTIEPVQDSTEKQDEFDSAFQNAEKSTETNLNKNKPSTTKELEIKSGNKLPHFSLSEVDNDDGNVKLSEMMSDVNTDLSIEKNLPSSSKLSADIQLHTSSAPVIGRLVGKNADKLDIFADFNFKSVTEVQKLPMDRPAVNSIAAEFNITPFNKQLEDEDVLEDFSNSVEGNEEDNIFVAPNELEIEQQSLGHRNDFGQDNQPDQEQVKKSIESELNVLRQTKEYVLDLVTTEPEPTEHEQGQMDMELELTTKENVQENIKDLKNERDSDLSQLFEEIMQQKKWPDEDKQEYKEHKLEKVQKPEVLDFDQEPTQKRNLENSSQSVPDFTDILESQKSLTQVKKEFKHQDKSDLKISNEIDDSKMNQNALDMLKEATVMSTKKSISSSGFLDIVGSNKSITCVEIKLSSEDLRVVKDTSNETDLNKKEDETLVKSDEIDKYIDEYSEQAVVSERKQMPVKSESESVVSNALYGSDKSFPHLEHDVATENSKQTTKPEGKKKLKRKTESDAFVAKLRKKTSSATAQKRMTESNIDRTKRLSLQAEIKAKQMAKNPALMGKHDAKQEPEKKKRRSMKAKKPSIRSKKLTGASIEAHDDMKPVTDEKFQEDETKVGVKLADVDSFEELDAQASGKRKKKIDSGVKQKRKRKFKADEEQDIDWTRAKVLANNWNAGVSLPPIQGNLSSDAEEEETDDGLYDEKTEVYVLEKGVAKRDSKIGQFGGKKEPLDVGHSRRHRRRKSGRLEEKSRENAAASDLTDLLTAADNNKKMSEAMEPAIKLTTRKSQADQLVAKFIGYRPEDFEKKPEENNSKESKEPQKDGEAKEKNKMEPNVTSIGNEREKEAAATENAAPFSRIDFSLNRKIKKEAKKVEKKDVKKVDKKEGKKDSIVEELPIDDDQDFNVNQGQEGQEQKKTELKNLPIEAKEAVLNEDKKEIMLPNESLREVENVPVLAATEVNLGEKNKKIKKHSRRRKSSEPKVRPDYRPSKDLKSILISPPRELVHPEHVKRKKMEEERRKQFEANALENRSPDIAAHASLSNYILGATLQAVPPALVMHEGGKGHDGDMLNQQDASLNAKLEGTLSPAAGYIKETIDNAVMSNSLKRTKKHENEYHFVYAGVEEDLSKNKGNEKQVQEAKVNTAHEAAIEKDVPATDVRAEFMVTKTTSEEPAISDTVTADNTATITAGNVDNKTVIFSERVGLEMKENADEAKIDNVKEPLLSAENFDCNITETTLTENNDLMLSTNERINDNQGLPTKATSKLEENVPRGEQKTDVLKSGAKKEGKKTKNKGNKNKPLKASKGKKKKGNTTGSVEKESEEQKSKVDGTSKKAKDWNLASADVTSEVHLHTAR